MACLLHLRLFVTPFSNQKEKKGDVEEKKHRREEHMRAGWVGSYRAD